MVAEDEGCRALLFCTCIFMGFFYTYFVLSQKLSNFALQNHIISYSYGKNDKRNPDSHG